MRQHVESLEHEAEAIAPQVRELLVFQGADLAPLEEDRPGVDRLQARHHVEQGRFADPRVADHGDVLSGDEIERNGVEHGARAEALGDCGQAEHP
jgi:hypothetical protein